MSCAYSWFSCSKLLKKTQKTWHITQNETLADFSILAVIVCRINCVAYWLWNVQRVDFFFLFNLPRLSLSPLHWTPSSIFDLIFSASKSVFIHCVDVLLPNQVFLKSDDLCLMGGEHTTKKPTLPSAHILAMHVQQLEIGAFTLTTGAYKWTKLRYAVSDVWYSIYGTILLACSPLDFYRK